MPKTLSNPVAQKQIAAYRDSFFQLVEKSDGCWTWTGALNLYGYGMFHNSLAHRLSWVLANGPLSPGQCVLHQCDNPRCVRPEHLFIGTRTENNADAHRKGRMRYRTGASHPATIASSGELPEGFGPPMTYERACEMRALREAGSIYRDLAERFSVSFSTVFNVLSGRTWTRPDSLSRHLRRASK